MAYVDGFLIPVPNDRKDDYIVFSKEWTLQFREWGALEIHECRGDDVPPGEVTSFPRAVELKDGETVVFSWTLWPDKATRDAAWKRMEEGFPEPVDMPFDGRRMILGGFVPVHVIK